MNIKEANTTIENPKLKELFEQRRTVTDEEESKAVINHMAEEIVLKAKFLSPARVTRAAAPAANNSARIAFSLLAAPDGRKYCPAFTDIDEVNKWDLAKTLQLIVMTFDDYASMVVDNRGAEGIVINPFGDNIILEKGLLSRWRDKKQMDAMGHAERYITSNSQVTVSTPEPYPTELAAALSEAAANNPQVKALWLRMMEVNGDKSYLAVVDFSGDRNTLFNALGAAAKPHLGDYELSMVNFSDGLGKTAAENVMPIFRA